ncbi:20012_t:CDS:2 [Entrophospora sp. SA101]|nr:20012_t:CDS:2 [Entrophospora sp. SA101]
MYSYSIIIPDYRLDIENQEDLVEEIVRIYGYNNLPSSFLSFQQNKITIDKNQTYRELIRQKLGNLGYQEIITYSLVSQEIKSDFCSQTEDKFYWLLVPKSENRVYYRQSILPSHLKTVAYNLTHQNENLFFFEITEELHPYQNADIWLNQEKIGFLGKIHLPVSKKYQIDQPVFGAQISLTKDKQQSYQIISPFPKIEQDLSFIFAENVPAGKVVEIIKKNGAERIEELMKEDLNRLETSLRKIRSNQISLEAIEELSIQQQGKNQKIKQLATLKINHEGQLVIRVFEPKKTQAINKAVLESQLGYQQTKMEKNEIYFSLAPMTGEIRQQLGKKVKEMTEQGKAALRLSRQKILKSLKEKKLSQNEQKLVEKEIEKINEKYLKKIQELQAKKENELVL